MTAVTAPVPFDADAALAELTSLEESAARLRLHLQAAAGRPVELPPTVAGGGEPEFDANLRALRFLKAFVDAPANALTVDQTRDAAKAAGYDPRGVGGFYIGANASLRSVDQSRILTATGRGWYEEFAPQYAAELGLNEPTDDQTD